MKERDDRLGEASDLQKFLQSLDHFQQWLTITQTAIACDDIPSNLAEAEEMLDAHEAIFDEMTGKTPYSLSLSLSFPFSLSLTHSNNSYTSSLSAYTSEYEDMKVYGAKVIDEGKKDSNHMLFTQVFTLI